MPASLAQHSANAGLRQVTLEGGVIRCTCTADEKAADAWHGAHNQPCPHGVVVPLGELAHWHRNPLKRWAWRARRWSRALRSRLSTT